MTSNDPACETGFHIRTPEMGTILKTRVEKGKPIDAVHS